MFVWEDRVDLCAEDIEDAMILYLCKRLNITREECIAKFQKPRMLLTEKIEAGINGIRIWKKKP